MVERPILTASGEVLYGETPEDGIIAKFYGDPDLAKVAAQSVNAFAALAEHFGCKPEELEVDLVKWYEASKPFVEHAGNFDNPSPASLHALDTVLDCRRLRRALAHDTVDRADIGHEE